MDMLRRQVAVTPAPQWVRVVGGFTEHQFVEKRLPTIEEINAVAPDTPVFLLHLYDRALLNGAALRAVGYTRETPNPPGGEITRDANGNPTGLLLAKPNAGILYSTLAKGPKLPFDYQVNSTRHFMRELNRLGVTGVIDAGGGNQNYPDDYEVIQKLSDENQLTVRLAYNLFTQKPKQEKEDFLNWTSSVRYKQGNDYFRHNGAGEMLVFSAADFEDFRQPRPEMAPEMEGELEEVVRILAQNRWPWRLHATYDETISRALDVFEKVDKDIPLEGLNWFFDHAETISDRSIDRIAALGGGIATQHRMAYQGEYFVERYGHGVQRQRRPSARCWTRASTSRRDRCHPRRFLQSMGLALLDGDRQDGWRHAALSAAELPGPGNRTSHVDGKSHLVLQRGGQEGPHRKRPVCRSGGADKDFFSCREDEISFIVSELTMVSGKIVYGAGDFRSLDENDIPPAMPDWSPVRTFGGYAAWVSRRVPAPGHCVARPSPPAAAPATAACMATTMPAPGPLNCRLLI